MRLKEVALSSVLLCALCLLMPAPAAWSALGCEWLPGSTAFDDGDIYALTTFDDGSGPALYVAGEFTLRSGLTMNHIARWDGLGWSALSGPSGTGTNGDVHALAVWDDGSGPALYVGGSFTSAGGVAVTNIAKWDGSEWSALATGFPGPEGYTTVYAMAAHDDGSGSALYVGGSVVDAANLRKWDGSTWTTIASSPQNSGFYALAVYDFGSGEDLYVGGDFDTVGSIYTFNVARWNSGQWLPLEGDYAQNGVNGPVRSLAVFNDGSGPALYVGGEFDTASGVTANNIASWDGTGWSALTGGGVSGSIHALALYNGSLYAGGRFETAGGVATVNIARWDGTAWSALTVPSGIASTQPVFALAVFDEGSGDSLFAGGTMIKAGGLLVNRLARWDGSQWSALSEWWSASMKEVVDGAVYATAVWDDGSGPALYVAGSFNHAGGVWAQNIAKWDGTTWSALNGPSGNGVEVNVNWAPTIYALAVYDDGSGSALYAAGMFQRAGGELVNNVAKWDGTRWWGLSGPSGTGIITGSSGEVRAVFALAVYDGGGGPELYAGGRFTQAGGVLSYNFAKWDGSQWTAMPGFNPNTPNVVRALTVWDDGGGADLYLGGVFGPGNAPGFHNIARFDGSTYTGLYGSVGEGTSGRVDALVVYNGSLYVGGEFEYAGGWFASRIARWSGSNWSILSPNGSPGVYAPSDCRVLSMAVHNDGSGSKLYLGGNFETADRMTVNNIVAWDGSAWSALTSSSGTGVSDGSVNTLISFDDGTNQSLVSGGEFLSAAGTSSPGLARWLCNGPIFSDGFENGNTASWGWVVGGP